MRLHSFTSRSLLRMAHSYADLTSYSTIISLRSLSKSFYGPRFNNFHQRSITQVSSLQTKSNANRGNIRLYSSRKEGLGKPKGYAGFHQRYTLERHCLSGLPRSSDSKPYIVLGIESSCDDTGVAVVRSDGVILSNIVYSQYDLHARFGGVVPGLAMEAHRNNIDKALKEALERAGLKSVDDVDAIAVTKGPGLEICLRIGINKAKLLAQEYSKPFVTVHHLEAHCLISRLAGVAMQSPNEPKDLNHISYSSSMFQSKIQYPFLAFLASGGHTSLLICKGLGDYDVLGGTRDDALGEAFDKASRLLGLQSNMSGGVAIEMMARKGDSSKYQLSVPMRGVRSCDFSYAGLKTSFRMLVESARVENGLNKDVTNAPSQAMTEISEIVTLPDEVTADLCATFQETAIAHVIDKMNVALDYVKNSNIQLKGIALVGGVAANQYLREQLVMLLKSRAVKYPEESNLKLVYPPPNLCTDNGVMAAWAGIEKLSLGISDSPDNVEPISRWPLGSLVAPDKQCFAKISN